MSDCVYSQATPSMQLWEAGKPSSASAVQANLCTSCWWAVWLWRNDFTHPSLFIVISALINLKIWNTYYGADTGWQAYWGAAVNGNKGPYPCELWQVRADKEVKVCKGDSKHHELLTYSLKISGQGERVSQGSVSVSRMVLEASVRRWLSKD